MTDKPIAYPETHARATWSNSSSAPKVADPYRWLENDVRTDPRGRRLGRR